jgi:serine/threonine protein phosphatase PrpC
MKTHRKRKIRSVSSSVENSVLPEKRQKLTEHGNKLCTIDFIGEYTSPGTRYGDLNQDKCFWKRYYTQSGEEVVVLGLYDGHGRHGEKAAETAVTSTNAFLQKALADLDTSSNRFPTRRVKRMLHELFHQIHSDILSIYPSLTTLQWKGETFKLKQAANGVMYYINDKNEVFLHDFGTTGVVVLLFSLSKVLVVGDVGDSKALLIKQQNRHNTECDNSPNWVYLTVSHNISENSEDRKRIETKYKNVTEIEDGYLQPKDDAYKFHRIAMTRALGHIFLQNYGVISDPHIRIHSLNEEDFYLVMGSDGLFDVVEDEEIFEMTLKYQNNPQRLARELVDFALNEWTVLYPTPTDISQTADNTTVLVMNIPRYFQHLQ